MKSLSADRISPLAQSSSFSKEKGRVMSGIGGGTFYFCFEEVRCELLGRCSSKRFVVEGWLININIKTYLRFLLTTCRVAFRILLKGGGAK